MSEQTELEWKQPPPENRRPPSRHDTVIAQLQANPGEWARVARDMSSSGAKQGWIARGCEAITRRAETKGKGFWDVYARWPEPDPTAEDIAKNLAADPPEQVKPVHQVHTEVELAAAQADTPEPKPARLLPPGTRVKHRPVPGKPGQTRAMYTLDGATRPEPPPEPLPELGDESAEQQVARRHANRLAVDRWKRGTPPLGKPLRGRPIADRPQA